MKAAPRPTRHSSPTRSRESGASLVELLVVLALIGILSNLAIHSALEYKRRAEAASVVADFRLFRDAVVEHYTHAGSWPRDRGRKKEPPELTRYLNGKLRWSNPTLGIEYDWENWVRRNGSYKQPQTGIARGFSVVIPKRRRFFEHIYEDIQKVYDGPVVQVRRNRLTFVIDPIYELPEEEEPSSGGSGGGSGNGGTTGNNEGGNSGGGNSGNGSGNGGGNGTGNEGQGNGSGGSGGNSGGGNSGNGSGNGGGNGTGNEGQGKGKK